MDAERLAELRKLEAAAHAGPWYTVEWEDGNWHLESDEFFLSGDDGLFEQDAALIAAARNALPELLAEIERLQAAQRWIPVGERLPEADPNEDQMSVDVLVCYIDSDDGNTACSVAWYDFMWEEWRTTGPGEVDIFDVPEGLVTHWRPLPARPDTQP
jgi:hypothetical protein